ncbi:MAG TPA: bifunctional acetate--CoA ligase family protein/GNAT family N-acetyltransferase [Candidatus Dormibacteraeota bacterium]|nr:bifunctional acetate--CoA ligase family protein/GNAT family N-acetyltransferase [Candidatus Dormibacteraeota bacterium]
MSDSGEYLSENRTSLQSMLSPKSVAVIGATDRQGSVGRTVLEKLRADSFHGHVYAVNPNHAEVLGMRAYPSIAEVPEKIDLAVVVTPAKTVPDVIGECVDAGVRAGVVISAGFKERGEEGAALEREIQNHLRRGKMRLIGPNCLGVMNPHVGLNATFAENIARAGNVAFLSQSGALLTAILDWSFQEQVGFSAVVSTGSMLDVGWGDLIDHFGDDVFTGSILLYMESVGDARSFLSAAREVALRKPIIVIKAGRTAAASKAASSHTGALTGSDEVFDAALRRCGVLRVSSISDLFYMAEVLSKQPRPRGPKLTILTNAGGPGVLATDALLATGGELSALSDISLQALNQLLPPHWSHANPIDILGDADPERYAKALEIAAKDPESDGLLVILAPQGMTDPSRVADQLKAHAAGQAKIHGKPVLASWMGGKSVATGVATLNAAGIPTFSYPDTAARAFTYMWKYTYNLRGLYETPVTTGNVESAGETQSQARDFLEKIRGSGRTILTEAEAKHVIALYGIPAVETRLAGTESEAEEIAQAIGFPVVLKLNSETITHKSDVGGIKLNLPSREAVRKGFCEIEAAVREKAGAGNFQGVTVQPMIEREGYELILGSSVDAQFGPVILFGSGGQLVEVYGDRALALPPLNSTLAVRLMEQTKIFRALQGVRGRAAVNMAALENALVDFSRLVVEQPLIREIDINPLLASGKRVLALDARIILQDREIPAEHLPRTAIRPYPVRYVSSWTAKNGMKVLLRPIRPEDEPAMAKFHETLSDRSVYLRFFHMEKLSSRVAHERLTSKCFIDYDREMALVADWENPSSREHEIVAVGRLTRLHGSNEAEVAVLVADLFHRCGLGSELLGRLIQVAHDEKLESITATILHENMGMRALAARFGFDIMKDADLSVIRAVLPL